jgi:hypothetical protein
MAMNKKEQAYFEQLLTVAALRYTADVNPDIPVPGTCSKESKGFMFYGESGMCPRIEKIISSSVNHRTEGSSCGSQGGVYLYSSKLRALKAMRRETEKICARKLRDIDIMIEKEEKESTHNKEQ